MLKDYIGDSVYAELTEGRQIILTTENGFGPSNTIVLEPEVLAALVRYSELANSIASTASSPK
jgi:hypothetical protein